MSLDRPVTTVCHDDAARHISRHVGSQEYGRAHDILRLAGAAERRVIHEGLNELRIVNARVFVQRRFDQAGTDRVDPDTIFAEFRSQCFREAEHAMFGGRIGR